MFSVATCYRSPDLMRVFQRYGGGRVATTTYSAVQRRFLHRSASLFDVKYSWNDLPALVQILFDRNPNVDPSGLKPYRLKKMVKDMDEDLANSTAPLEWKQRLQDLQSPWQKLYEHQLYESVKLSGKEKSGPLTFEKEKGSDPDAEGSVMYDKYGRTLG
eukprot:GEMP01039720.1.p1 GENE.GEMP01039720.1~~GEMP01039720.1.p1  ORF type:complete len:159 (+),score=28.11 GEMP01039720.1:219-695(+)